jgi:hypothetical protein
MSRIDVRCAIYNITFMARGDSGRIVIEVDPRLKDELYLELAKQRMTLKAWFMTKAEQFVDNSRQQLLFVSEPDSEDYSSAATNKGIRK